MDWLFCILCSGLGVTFHLEWDSSDKAVRNISVGSFTALEFSNFVGTSLEYEIVEDDLELLESYTGRIPANISLICKGISQCRWNSPSYSISNHLKKYRVKLFKFSSDDKSL